ncbi:hypothetical protein ACIP01_11235 [Pseudomonas monteilii]|uniref:hypothetical protein n=1 Tax=Pseudomonas monteilii TaxID=76759 RepID=UPI0038168FFC
MTILKLAALPLLVAESYATADQISQLPRTGHVEVSVRDIPEGISEHLDEAIREYRKNPGAGKGSASLRKSTSSEEVIAFPKERVLDVDNASLEARLKQTPTMTDFSSLRVKLIDLNVTASCKLVTTQPNGVYIRTTKEHSGFSRFFRCPDGAVYSRAMTFYGMRKITIKEQNNVHQPTFTGQMYGSRDKHGNSYTTLSWVSNNIDHVVQKTGLDESTRNWLIQYADELVAK